MPSFLIINTLSLHFIIFFIKNYLNWESLEWRIDSKSNRAPPCNSHQYRLRRVALLLPCLQMQTDRQTDIYFSRSAAATLLASRSYLGEHLPKHTARHSACVADREDVTDRMYQQEERGAATLIFFFSYCGCCVLFLSVCQEHAVPAPPHTPTPPTSRETKQKLKQGGKRWREKKIKRVGRMNTGWQREPCVLLLNGTFIWLVTFPCSSLVY